MGKAEGPVDSDYSGRPLRRPAAEDLAGDSAPGNYVGAEIPPDDEIVFQGPDGRLYHRHFDRHHNPIWDRPVDPEIAKAIGWKVF